MEVQRKKETGNPRLFDALLIGLKDAWLPEGLLARLASASMIVRYTEDKIYEVLEREILAQLYPLWIRVSSCMQISENTWFF